MFLDDTQTSGRSKIKKKRVREKKKEKREKKESFHNITIDVKVFDLHFWSYSESNAKMQSSTHF